MPNRILKESICRSEEIDSLSWFEEVLFYRLIVNCDDYGRFDARTKIIKSCLFPLKDITERDVEKALNKLSAVGLVRVYTAQGRPVLQLVTWENHQRIRNRKSKYPGESESDKPRSLDNNCQQVAVNCQQAAADCGLNPIQSESESKSESESEEKGAPGMDQSAGSGVSGMDQSAGNDENKYHYAEIVSYLNQKAGTSFRDSAKDTRKYIRARIDEGYTLDDFYAVIDKKTAEWGTPKAGEKDMSGFLRPKTLFSTNFESYLGQKKVDPRTSASKFSNFDQRNYDFNSLEAQLLQADEEQQ